MGNKNLKRSLIKIGKIVQKEFLSLSRDKTSLFFTIAVPVFILLAFGLSYTEGDPILAVELDIAVTDQDEGPFGDLFTQYLKDSDLVNVKANTSTVTEADDLIREGSVAGAVIIPQNFSYSIFNNATAFILVKADDSKHIVPPYLESKISRIVADFAENEITSGQASFLTIREETISGRDMPLRAAAVPLILGLALIFSCFDDTAGAIARERSKGTLTRLFISKISRWDLFIGKTLSSVILTIFRTIILLLIVKFYFNVKIIGSLILIFIVATLIAINTIGIGLVISVRQVSERAVVIANFAFMVPLIFLTGILQPIDLFPETTREAVKFIPYVWTNDALRRVVHLGQGLSSISFNLLYACFTAFLLYITAALAWKGRID